MAYGKLFYNEWTDYWGNQFELKIDKQNYTGSAKRMPYVDGYSINHSLRGGRDAEYNPVHGSELNFSVWCVDNMLMFHDTEFDSNFDFWKQDGTGALPWFYVNGNMYNEPDGGDYTQYLYQPVNIEAGKVYKLVIDYKLDDPNENHELQLEFSNSTTSFTGSQLYSFDVDGDFWDGEKTITLTASTNYRYAGFRMYAGGASVHIRSAKLYKSDTLNYSQMMEANYNEFKATLKQKNKNLLYNSDFKLRNDIGNQFNSWGVSGDSGISSWTWNGTYNTLYVVSDGGSVSDTLAQDINIVKGNVYTVAIEFTIDNNWNNSVFKLVRFVDPVYDPPTDVILMSGNTGVYYNPNVAVIDSESTDLGMWYKIEYTFTADTFYSSAGFSFKSDDEGCYIHSFKVLNDLTVFVGWVKPENITKRFLKSQYYINVNCIDGLADLKNFEYQSNPDYVPMIQIMEGVLGYTGLNLPFLIQNNIHHTTTGTKLFDCMVDRRRWIDGKLGKRTYASAYTVLEDILRIANCRLIQYNGTWLIQNTTENNTNRFNYQTGSTRYAGIGKRTIDISDWKFLPDTDELSKIQQLKGIDVTVDNVQYEDSFVYNGGFDMDLGGWTRHGTSWPTFQRISADEDAYLRCRTTSNGTFGSGAYYFSGMTYLPNPSPKTGIDRDTFSISLDLMIAAQPATVANRPWLRINAWREVVSGSDVGEQRQIRINNLAANEWHTITADFQTWTDMRDFFPDDLKVSIGCFFTGTTGNVYEIHFNNIKLEYEFAVDVDDKTKYTLNLDVPNPLLQVQKAELKMSDGYYTNDISVIRLPNGNRTTDWYNADFSITGATIVEMFAKERLRQNLGYKNYMRCQFLDEDYRVTPNSIVNLKDTEYKIVGYGRNFLMGTTEVECIEFVKGTLPTLSEYYKPSLTAFEI